MSFVARNHPQQVAMRGADDEIDDRGTRNEDLAALAERYRLGPFTLDVAAAPHNAKCERYFTRADNGLAQSWAGEWIWCNPPYSDCRSWVTKAWQEYFGTRGIAMLLPANRCEQAWWQEKVEPFRDCGGPLTTHFLPGRMRFERPDVKIGPKGDRPPFGCVLLVWRDRT